MIAPKVCFYGDVQAAGSRGLPRLAQTTEYSGCVQCGGCIYRSWAGGRTWRHIDIRQDAHRAVPIEGGN
jgi:hypothetical protein